MGLGFCISEELPGRWVMPTGTTDICVTNTPLQKPQVCVCMKSVVTKNALEIPCRLRTVPKRGGVGQWLPSVLFQRCEETSKENSDAGKLPLHYRAQAPLLCPCPHLLNSHGGQCAETSKSDRHGPSYLDTWPCPLALGISARGFSSGTVYN